MSDTPPSKSNRTRLLIAVAILAGAIILLVVTEMASLPEEENSPPAPSTEPADQTPPTP
ncbi:MAG: hypothetical protein ACREIA_00320 [Opitutaceae bacterium]